MSVARQLYQLQEIDLEIADEERRLEQVKGRRGRDDVVVAVQQKLDVGKEKREELQHNKRSIEGEIDDMEGTLKKGEGGR